MGLRVLFADDQIPSDDAEANQAAKDEIVRVLGSKVPDIETLFEEDHQWFTGLVDFLETVEGCDVLKAKTVAIATEMIDNPDTFDVAIIDMSWSLTAGSGTKPSLCAAQSDVSFFRATSRQEVSPRPWKGTPPRNRFANTSVGVPSLI